MVDQPGTSPHTWIEIAYTKWRDAAPHAAHYAYRMRLLGEDERGVWGSCDVGEEVFKEGKLAFVREEAFLCLVPRVGCWSALWYPPSDAEYEVYVDINSHPVWSEDRVTMVDLDFDVVRKRDGSVMLVDEDEFEAHSVAYGYPDELVELARSAAATVFDDVATPAEPFSTAWRSWYSLCFPAE